MFIFIFRDAKRGRRMAAHLCRFTDMHPVAVLVSADLPESTILSETTDRRVHGSRSIREPRSSTRIASVRDSYAHSTE